MSAEKADIQPLNLVKEVTGQEVELGAPGASLVMEIVESGHIVCRNEDALAAEKVLEVLYGQYHCHTFEGIDVPALVSWRLKARGYLATQIGSPACGASIRNQSYMYLGAGGLKGHPTLQLLKTAPPKEDLLHLRTDGNDLVPVLPAEVKMVLEILLQGPCVLTAQRH